MSKLSKRHRTLDGPAIIECVNCGHRGTTRSRGVPAYGAADLKGKTLRCSRCGHVQTIGADIVPPRPGFRREGDTWVVEMKNGERQEFNTREAAWAWLDRTAPSASIH
jgi:hypothetical protein